MAKKKYQWKNKKVLNEKTHYDYMQLGRQVGRWVCLKKKKGIKGKIRKF